MAGYFRALTLLLICISVHALNGFTQPKPEGTSLEGYLNDRVYLSMAVCDMAYRDSDVSFPTGFDRASIVAPERTKTIGPVFFTSFPISSRGAFLTTGHGIERLLGAEETETKNGIKFKYTCDLNDIRIYLVSLSKKSLLSKLQRIFRSVAQGTLADIPYDLVSMQGMIELSHVNDTLLFHADTLDINIPYLCAADLVTPLEQELPIVSMGIKYVENKIYYSYEQQAIASQVPGKGEGVIFREMTLKTVDGMSGAPLISKEDSRFVGMVHGLQKASNNGETTNLYIPLRLFQSLVQAHQSPCPRGKILTPNSTLSITVNSLKPYTLGSSDRRVINGSLNNVPGAIGAYSLLADEIVIQNLNFDHSSNIVLIGNKIDIATDIIKDVPSGTSLTLIANEIVGGALILNGRDAKIALGDGTNGNFGQNGANVAIYSRKLSLKEISVRGGMGGDGTTGARGQNGRDGVCSGFGRWEPALAGGRGQSGGNAGAGGSGGNIILKLASQPSDAMYRLEAGEDGRPAPGGRGGRGGAGCTGLGGTQSTAPNGTEGDFGIMVPISKRSKAGELNVKSPMTGAEMNNFLQCIDQNRLTITNAPGLNEVLSKCLA